MEPKILSFSIPKLLLSLVFLQVSFAIIKTTDAHDTLERPLLPGFMGPPIPAPEWRAGHAAVAVGDYMVIWGGVREATENPYLLVAAMDVYVYSLVDHTWYQPRVTPAPGCFEPPPQKFHSAIVINSTQILYVFGIVGDTSDSPEFTMTVVLDTILWQWNQHPSLNKLIKSTEIYPMWGAMTVNVLDNQILIVHGGIGVSRPFKAIDHVSESSRLNKNWTYVNLNDPNRTQSLALPPSLFGSSCYLSNNASVVLFGGRNTFKGENDLFDDATNMRGATNQFFGIPLADLENRLYASNLKGLPPTRDTTSANVPSPRQSHTGNCLGSHMVVYGGANTLYPNDSNVYILRSINGQYVWSATDTSQDLSSPGPRMGHSTVVWNNTVVLFGGWGPNKVVGDTAVYFLNTNISGNISWTNNSANNQNTTAVMPKWETVLIVSAAFAFFTLIIIVTFVIGMIIARHKNHRDDRKTYHELNVVRQKNYSIEDDVALPYNPDEVFHKPDERD
ncbi:hypothetical protein BC936DRAFT_142403 [Jimgerdemannia flammicorona]|uniref:Galactose oxidase n=1 Tax=Jimgerdemannia flammicorona TaxID=994334 RepID=A0A433DF89_9FUNG|nr:hypothetical protein BC936DRAFT_142403 [Jimgerdemannia flammicorona]